MGEKNREGKNEPTRIAAFYRIKVHDKEGRLIKDYGEHPSHSFVLQFLEAFYAMSAGIDYAVTTIGGTEDTWGMNNLISLDGAIGNEYEGIVIGTGITAEANTDIALSALINNGIGSGQMEYGVQQFPSVPAVVGANVDWVLERIMANSSGGTITITEIGIHMQEGYLTGVATCRLMIRDLLAASADVLDTQAITVTYTLRTTV